MGEIDISHKKKSPKQYRGYPVLQGRGASHLT